MWFLVWLALTRPPDPIAKRHYYVLTLAKLVRSQQTHVQVCGPVVYSRTMADGDRHVTLDDGRTKVVLEIIPKLPLPFPRKGWRICARGIRRVDEDHNWLEVHPVEAWWLDPR